MKCQLCILRTDLSLQTDCHDIAYYASSPEQSRFYQNACAARLSYAFNKAGIKIPRIKGVTQRGAGKLNYFLRAADMRKWLTRKWDTPTLIKNIKRLTTGVTSQTGFGNNISGHVGIVYRKEDCTGLISKYFKDHAPTSIWYGR